MKALSIKEPFASLIILGLKNKEHRTRNTQFRGRFIVHSSKVPDKNFIDEYGFDHKSLRNGKLIGTVELYDTIQYHNGVYAWLLRNPKQFKTTICHKGQLGFFNIKSINPLENATNN